MEIEPVMSAMADDHGDQCATDADHESYTDQHLFYSKGEGGVIIQKRYMLSFLLDEFELVSEV